MTIESSVPNLRPLRMGELLDRIIRLYRQNFLTFIGIVALVQVPVILLQLLMTIFVTGRQFETFSNPTNPTPADISQFTTAAFTTFIVSMFVIFLSFVLVQGLGTAALTRAVANSYLGQKTGVIEAYRQIGSSWLKLLLALLVAFLIGILLFIWVLIPCVGWITGGGIMLFYVGVVVPLIAPVIVLENYSAAGAVQRVWGMARQRFWWVFGFAVLLIIFNYLVVSGPATLISLGFQSATGDPFSTTFDNSQFVLQNVVQTLVTLIFSLLYLPIQLAGYTLLYFDLRVRLEGFDLALLASETAEDGSLDAAGAIQSAPKAEGRFAVTLNEMGYFAMITIALFIVLFIFGSIASSLLFPFGAGF